MLLILTIICIIIECRVVQPMMLDLIIQKTGLSSGEVSSSLLQLELLGLVTQLPGMRYQKN